MSAGTKFDIDWRVYRDKRLTHLLGPNPGTPYTACGLDAGDMVLTLHPPDIAAVWCIECLRAVAFPTAGTQAGAGVTGHPDNETRITEPERFDALARAGAYIRARLAFTCEPVEDTDGYVFTVLGAVGAVGGGKDEPA